MLLRIACALDRSCVDLDLRRRLHPAGQTDKEVLPQVELRHLQRGKMSNADVRLTFARGSQAVALRSGSEFAAECNHKVACRLEAEQMTNLLYRKGLIAQ